MSETLCAKASLKLCLKQSGCKSFQSIFSLSVRSFSAEKKEGKEEGGNRGAQAPLTPHSKGKCTQLYMISKPGTAFHWLVCKHHEHYAVTPSPMTKWLTFPSKDWSHFAVNSVAAKSGGCFPGWVLFMSHLLMDHYSHIHIQPVLSYKSCM